MTLSDKIVNLVGNQKNEFVIVPSVPTKNIKAAIKEIFFHRKCLNCKLNICECERPEWVIDINVIKEEFGKELTE